MTTETKKRDFYKITDYKTSCLAFWSKVEKSDGCWIWKGHISDRGYGRYRFGGRNCRRQMVHMIAYTLTKGTVPPELELDHVCRNKICVNPNHLEAVTHKENVCRGNIAIRQKSLSTRSSL